MDYNFNLKKVGFFEFIGFKKSMYMILENSVLISIVVFSVFLFFNNLSLMSVNYRFYFMVSVAVVIFVFVALYFLLYSFSIGLKKEYSNYLKERKYFFSINENTSICDLSKILNCENKIFSKKVERILLIKYKDEDLSKDLRKKIANIFMEYFQIKGADISFFLNALSAFEYYDYSEKFNLDNFSIEKDVDDDLISFSNNYHSYGFIDKMNNISFIEKYYNDTNLYFKTDNPDVFKDEVIILFKKIAEMNVDNEEDGIIKEYAEKFLQKNKAEV